MRIATTNEEEESLVNQKSDILSENVVKVTS